METMKLRADATAGAEMMFGGWLKIEQASRCQEVPTRGKMIFCRPEDIVSQASNFEVT